MIVIMVSFSGNWTEDSADGADNLTINCSMDSTVMSPRILTLVSKEVGPDGVKVNVLLSGPS